MAFVADDHFDVFGEDAHLEAEYEDRVWGDLPDDIEEDDHSEPEEEAVCEGHESMDGPIGNVTFCDGSCN